MGVVEKGKNGRLAIRFRGLAAMAAFAKRLGFEDNTALGRWKVVGVPVAAGFHGLAELLTSKGWQLAEIVYADEVQAVFLSGNRGQDLPCYYVRQGQPHQI
eukprot:12048930-Heterocapsa_arctica.AAC.1